MRSAKTRARRLEPGALRPRLGLCWRREAAPRALSCRNRRDAVARAATATAAAGAAAADPLASHLVRSRRHSPRGHRPCRRSRQPRALARRHARRRRCHRSRARDTRHLDLRREVGRAHAIHLRPRRRELVDLVRRQPARRPQLVRHASISICSRPRPRASSRTRC